MGKIRHRFSGTVPAECQAHTVRCRKGQILQHLRRFPAEQRQKYRRFHGFLLQVRTAETGTDCCQTQRGPQLLRYRHISHLRRLYRPGSLPSRQLPKILPGAFLFLLKTLCQHSCRAFALFCRQISVEEIQNPKHPARCDLLRMISV